MFTAQDAREAVRKHAEFQKLEEERRAALALNDILYGIKCNAEAGLSTYSTSDKTTIFKTQECEERVKKSLVNLGYTIDCPRYGANKLFISWWEKV